MKPTTNIAALLLLAIFSEPVISAPVPFKYPLKDPQEFENDTNSATSEVAIISGAGPAGLLAALALEKTTKYTQIIVVEERQEFLRFNTLSIRPEVMARLEEFDLSEPFLKTAIFSKNFTSKMKCEDSSESHLSEAFTKTEHAIDYSTPLASIFEGNGWPHFAINIADLQRMLAGEANKRANIFLVHGIIDLEMGSDGFNSVVINSENLPIRVVKPRLIVIAEGIGSSTREKLAISFEPVLEKEDEYWCSGLISLEGIIKESLPEDISIFIDKKDREGGFGVIRPHMRNVFVNGLVHISKKGSLSVEQCLRSTAYKLLQNRSSDIEMTMPSGPEELVILQTWPQMLHLIIKKADRSSSGLNTVLLGDAHRSGSPIGGIGFSMVATVENHALQELGQDIFIDNQKALAKFCSRLDDIANFWHFGGKI